MNQLTDQEKMQKSLESIKNMTKIFEKELKNKKEIRGDLDGLLKKTGEELIRLGKKPKTEQKTE